MHKCKTTQMQNCKTAKLQNCKTAQMHSCHRWKPPPDSVLYNGARTPHHRPTDNKPTIFTSDSMHLLNQHWNIQTNYYVLNLFHWFTLLICLICNFEEMDTASVWLQFSSLSISDIEQGILLNTGFLLFLPVNRLEYYPHYSLGCPKLWKKLWDLLFIVDSFVSICLKRLQNEQGRHLHWC